MNVRTIAISITAVIMMSLIISEHSTIDRLQADIAQQHAACLSRQTDLNGAMRALHEFNGSTKQLRGGL
jgi:hypothetical protein